MKPVKQILQSKGRDIYSVSPDDTVYHALELMAEKNIGAVLVLEGGELVGIFSERDYARKVVLKGKTSRETTIREVMSGKVVCVREEQPLEEAMALMSSKHIRHLPVIDNAQKLVGVLSVSDVVTDVISEQKFLIEQLENYIGGGR